MADILVSVLSIKCSMYVCIQLGNNYNLQNRGYTCHNDLHMMIYTTHCLNIAYPLCNWLTKHCTNTSLKPGLDDSKSSKALSNSSIAVVLLRSGNCLSGLPPWLASTDSVFNYTQYTLVYIRQSLHTLSITGWMTRSNTGVLVGPS